MSVEHPYLLIAAIVIALPVLVPLGRLFFVNRDEFAEEIGITPGPGRLELLLDALVVAFAPPFFGLRWAIVKLIALLVCWSAFIAAAYHLLTFAEARW